MIKARDYIIKQPTMTLIRSQKFRGCLSQGFSMKLSDFPEIDQNIETNSDVTLATGTKLWQAPVAGGRFGFNIGQSAGVFPSHLGVPKTDQERIQNISRRDMIDLFAHLWEVTEKVDGTSATYICHKSNDSEEYKFIVCSRNLQIKEDGEQTIEYMEAIGDDEAPTDTDIQREDGRWFRRKVKKEVVNSVYWEMARKYALRERITTYCMENNRSLALQGEIVGPGIQNNRLGLSEAKLLVFDIFDIETHRYVNHQDRMDIVTELNRYNPPEAKLVEHVPFFGIEAISPNLGMIQSAVKKLEAAIDSEAREDAKHWGIFMEHIMDMTVQKLLCKADGQVFTGHEFPREGIVYKSILNSQKSFKIISNLFLLKLKD